MKKGRRLLRQVKPSLLDNLLSALVLPGPGSTHLVAGLYEAARDHAPVLALSGEMPRKMQGIDYIQTTKPDLLFRDVALYTKILQLRKHLL